MQYIFLGFSLFISFSVFAADFTAGTYECKSAYSNGWSDVTFTVTNVTEQGADINLNALTITSFGEEGSPDCENAYQAIKDQAFAVQKIDFTQPGENLYRATVKPVGRWKAIARFSMSSANTSSMELSAEENGWDSPACLTYVELKDCKFQPPVVCTK